MDIFQNKIYQSFKVFTDHKRSLECSLKNDWASNASPELIFGKA
jgi:hypothetical protein